MRRNLDLPSAVLCDLDDTLYDYETAHSAGLQAVRTKTHRHLGVGGEEFDRAFEMAKKEVKARLGHTASSHSRLLYFQRLIEILGLRTQPLLTLDLEQTYWRTFLGTATLFDGVKEFFDELHALGIPRALVTDLTTQIQLRKVVYFQLESHFDTIVTSEEVGAEKPDPRPYNLALSKLGISRGPYWMIGDSIDKDMSGAKKAVGAVTFLRKERSLVPGAKHPDVDFIFEDFAGLRQILLDILPEDKRKIAGAV